MDTQGTEPQQHVYSDRYILPEEVELISGKNGLFHTDSARNLNKTSGAQFLQNPPPVLDENLKFNGPHTPYCDARNAVENGVDDLLRLIHSICKEEGEIVAFRHGYLKMRLKELYEKYREDQRRYNEQQADKHNKENSPIFILIKKVNKLAVNLLATLKCSTKQKSELEKSPAPNPPENPGWLAINEFEFNPELFLMNGLLEPTKHHPLKIILKALVDLGYLKTTKLSSKYVPTDPILALTIYEPTQKMIDSASQTA